MPIAIAPTNKELRVVRVLTDEKIKKAFIQQSIKMSDIDTGIEPETSDRFITLSTCTGLGHETRWVVQAVLDTD